MTDDPFAQFDEPPPDPVALELTREWNTLQAPPKKWLAKLDDAGVSIDARLRAGGIMFARTNPTGIMWAPAPSGPPMLILGLWLGEAPSIYGGADEPILLDMIAFDPEQPDSWYFRVTASGILGAHSYEEALEAGEPLHLHPTPLAWLQADCRGAVMLDVERPASDA